MQIVVPTVGLYVLCSAIGSRTKWAETAVQWTGVKMSATVPMRIRKSSICDGIRRVRMEKVVGSSIYYGYDVNTLR